MVDWDYVKSKTKNFIYSNGVGIRYEKTLLYQMLLSDMDKYIMTPDIGEGSSVYRYSFMVREKNVAQSLSDYLRDNGINCSNLYLPVSKFYNNNDTKNAEFFAERVINLWVDDVANEKYIYKSVEIIKKYFHDCMKVGKFNE